MKTTYTHFSRARHLGLLSLGLILLLWSQPGLGGPESAPDFALDQCLLADTLSLSGLLGHPAVLFFFDGGNRTSQLAYRYVRNWQAKYRADNLAVIGFHCPEFKPLKAYANAASAVSAADLKIPVGMDFDSKVRMKYAIEVLPAFVLLDPDGKIIFQTSDPAEFRMLEERIQTLLREIKPGTVLPFLFEPTGGAEGEAAGKIKPTPKIRFGLASGSIVGADSSGLDQFKIYTDSRERERGKVYLSGRWEVKNDALHYSESEKSYLRIIYSGKDVWLLPEPLGTDPVKVVIKQDRSYLPPELWGSDVRAGVEDAHPFIMMRNAIPKHIVSNAAFGTHELRLIPVEGEMSFYYIHFEGNPDR